jgi:molybdopterin converting factor small subunit
VGASDRARACGGEAPAAEVAPGRATGIVPVELVSWVTRFVGGDGTGRRIFDEPLAGGATVRTVLAGLSARYPELRAALWHGDAIGEHIEVLVNDAVLGIGHTLDSPVAPGDRITLLGQYMGG